MAAPSSKKRRKNVEPASRFTLTTSRVKTTGCASMTARHRGSIDSHGRRPRMCLGCNGSPNPQVAPPLGGGTRVDPLPEVTPRAVPSQLEAWRRLAVIEHTSGLAGPAVDNALCPGIASATDAARTGRFLGGGEGGMWCCLRAPVSPLCRVCRAGKPGEALRTSDLLHGFSK